MLFIDVCNFLNLNHRKTPYWSPASTTATLCTTIRNNYQSLENIMQYLLVSVIA